MMRNMEESVVKMECNISTSLFKIKKKILKLINMDYMTIDTCVDTCVAFTDMY
jgi:hypothetical protein